MNQTDPIATVAPLMFLVVLKIADVSREMDLNEIQGTESWAYYDIFGNKQQPGALGPFSYLHCMCFVLLYLIFISAAYSFEGSLFRLVTKFEGDLLTAILAGTTVVLWALLPILEVDEYSSIELSDNQTTPKSVENHVAHVAGIAILSILIARFVTFVQNSNPQNIMTQIASIILLALVLLVFYFSYRGIRRYLELLDGEMSDSF